MADARARPSDLPAGLMAALLTPFGADGRPHLGRMLSLCKALLEAGVQGLIPFGTTGEGASIGLDERMEMLESLIEAGIPADRLIPGVGLTALPDTVALAAHATTLGCRAVLIQPPFYFRAASEDGLLAYYARAIEQVADDRLRLMLYHIPDTAGIGLTASLIGRLTAAFPHVVVGLKDSSADGALSAEVAAAHPQLAIYAGTEARLGSCLDQGGAGLITTLANIDPASGIAAIAAHGTPDWDGALATLLAARAALKTQAVIPHAKAIRAAQTRDPQWRVMRPPLMPLDGPVAPDVLARFLGAGDPQP